MKRMLLAVTILGLFLPAIKQVEAEGDLSIDFFYDNLGSDGSWVEVADYGYCWQPAVAVSDRHWRPYADGYWAYTDVGWTWVSNEDFGWATYHYGRWTRLRDRGWFWVPGREWGPAWVSWRTGGDYVGWAPLPPRGRGDVDDNRPINGHVDVDFDIGPAYYNFIEVRYIGEPVLRERIVEPRLNVTYISQTVNVTNITYTNSVVYNYGPDYDTVSRYSTRPVRRMRLERENNVDATVAVQSNARLRVQGDRLLVVAPSVLQKSAKPIAPKAVKEKIEKPTVERGWDDVSEPKAQAEMKEKFKKEDSKNVPPPSFTPNANAAPAATTPAAGAGPASSPKPAMTAAPVASASPALAPDKDRGKNMPLKNASPMPAAATPIGPISTQATTSPGKSKNVRDEKPVPALTPPASTGQNMTPAPKHEKRPTTPSNLITSPDGTPYREPVDRSVKKEKPEKAPDMMPPTRQPSEPPADKAPRKSKDEAAAPSTPKQVPQEVPHQKTTTPPPESSSVHQPPKSEAPKEHTAPPPRPPGNEPAKAEAPHSKQAPDKKPNQPVPTPSS